MDKNEKHSQPRWKTANSEFYREYSEARKELMNSMTEAEKLLWEKLKSKQLGVKFRRQHIIATFIPDFVALSIKLIVEVDGKIHLKNRAKDDERTLFLKMMGYKVIRFTNEEVENNIEEVVDRIKRKIDSMTPPSLPKGEVRL